MKTIYGVGENKILDKIQNDNTISAWISGSLVEGFGNEGSDLDVFVAVKDIEQETEYVNESKVNKVDVKIEERRRVDYEYWPIRAIEEIAEKLNGIKINDENVNILDSLNSKEVDFIQRIKIGKAIYKKKRYEEIKELFNYEIFRNYLVQNRILYVDDSFDDAVGMMQSGDLECAVLRARYTVELSIEALLLFNGDTNDKFKYIPKKLEKLVSRERNMKWIYDKYWKFEKRIPDGKENKKDYIKEALNFSSRIIEIIQEKN